MAYDTALEAKIDELTAGWDVPLTKKKMFGGLGYFVYGNMCFAVRAHGGILLRLDDTKADEVLELPGLEIAVMGKKVMKNWLTTDTKTVADNKRLLQLLEIGRDYALSLPPK